MIRRNQVIIFKPNRQPIPLMHIRVQNLKHFPEREVFIVLADWFEMPGEPMLFMACHKTKEMLAVITIAGETLDKALKTSYRSVWIKEYNGLQGIFEALESVSLIEATGNQYNFEGQVFREAKLLLEEDVWKQFTDNFIGVGTRH